MLLKELVKDLDNAEIIGDENAVINGITIDSKKIAKNYLFICISGNNYDSHNLYGEAERYGASALVTERVLATSLTQIVVPDSRAAMSRIASRFYGDPSRKLKIIGVTGTNGKTTTTHIIRDILEAQGKRVGLIGTLGVFFGKTFYEPTLTTPDPIELHKIFKDMYDYGIDYAVMEVSAHALALDKLNDVKFEVGIFTNFTQDHLDFFKTMENYRSAKMRFFADGFLRRACIDYDDETGRKILEIHHEFTSYGMDEKAEFRAIDINERAEYTSFRIEHAGRSYAVKMPLLGRFNVSNALAAVTALSLIGIAPAESARALEHVKTVAGRLELVSSRAGVNVYVDYAHTPDGLENCLKTLKNFTEKRVILVFGCGGNRDAGKRPLMGEIAGRLADFTVITSDNPRYEEPMEIIRAIEKGILKVSENYVSVQKRERAIEYALGLAKSGDSVLIAGKGAEKYQEILGIKHAYNDNDCIKNFYSGNVK